MNYKVTNFFFSFSIVMGPFTRHHLSKYLHLILAFIEHWKILLFLWKSNICILRGKKHLLGVNLRNVFCETAMKGFEKIPKSFPWGWLHMPDFFLSFRFSTLNHLLLCVILVVSQYCSIALIEACFA